MSRPKRRAKVRRRPNWAPLIVLTLFLNLALAYLYSPLTSIRRVRVLGAAPYDQLRISRHLQLLGGVAAAQAPADQVESLLLANEEVQAAKIYRNPFGSALLELRLRRPVAGLANLRGRFLAEDGEVFSSPAEAPGLPWIVLDAGAGSLNLSLAGAYEVRRLATLCAMLRKLPSKSPWTVQVGGAGMLSLSSGAAGKVVLGSARNLDEKIRVLARILGEKPQILESVRELNITYPSAPVFVPLNSSNEPLRNPNNR